MPFPKGNSRSGGPKLSIAALHDDGLVLPRTTASARALSPTPGIYGRFGHASLFLVCPSHPPFPPLHHTHTGDLEWPIPTHLAKVEGRSRARVQRGGAAGRGVRWML